jgi:hypothetical protein
MTVPAETAPVLVVVQSIELVSMGAVMALATVDLEIDGVNLRIEGVRVTRRGGLLACEPPHFRDPRSGQWRPALLLPKELSDVIAGEVLQAVRS